MAVIDPESLPPDPTPQNTGSHLSPTREELFSKPLGRLLVTASGAALVAAVASLLAGEMIWKAYESALFPPLKITPTAEDMRQWREARLYSATLTFTAMGGIIGLTMGLAGGLARRSFLAGTKAAILGYLLGTTIVALISLAVVSVFFTRYDPQAGDLTLPLLTHGLIWSAVGAIGGLAFGLGLGGKGRWKATMMGGLVGAAAAAVIYELVGALAFASSKTELPVSFSVTTRAISHLLVALLCAAGAVLFLNQYAKREPPSSPST